jgi:hypothetical protein
LGGGRLLAISLGAYSKASGLQVSSAESVYAGHVLVVVAVNTKFMLSNDYNTLVCTIDERMKGKNKLASLFLIMEQ